MAATGKTPGKVGSESKHRPIRPVWSNLYAFTNKRRDTSASLTGLEPELPKGRFGKLDRYALHAHNTRVTQS